MIDSLREQLAELAGIGRRLDERLARTDPSALPPLDGATALVELAKLSRHLARVSDRLTGLLPFPAHGNGKAAKRA